MAELTRYRSVSRWTRWGRRTGRILGRLDRCRLACLVRRCLVRVAAAGMTARAARSAWVERSVVLGLFLGSALAGFVARAFVGVR